jgi:hypothetical protein
VLLLIKRNLPTPLSTRQMYAVMEKDLMGVEEGRVMVSAYYRANR